MLLRFRCKNFRSIREEQELSLIAAKTRTDEKSESLIDTSFEDLKLLRCAAIYGPNASGKSNVLAALSTFSQMVSESQRLWKPDGQIPHYSPFLLDEDSRGEPTEFEIVFLLDSSVLRYGFRFDRTAFLAEWLVDATSRDKVLFRRELNEGETTFSFPARNLVKSAEDGRHLESIRMDVRLNSLLLSAGAQRNNPALSKISGYLAGYLEILPNRDSDEYEEMTRLRTWHRDRARRGEAAKMLAFADVGIREITLSTLDPSFLFNPNVEPSLRIRAPDLYPHGEEFPPSAGLWLSHAGAAGKSYFLSEKHESAGTLAYLRILAPLLNKLRDGGILLIDELESSLHPTLARELVRIFNSPELNPKGAQFVFTTHNTNLLDLQLLRRDQVWFTEKSREGTTRLFPLTDYQPRTNQNIELGYLGGRFGALPYLDEQLLRETLIPEEPVQASLHFSEKA